MLKQDLQGAFKISNSNFAVIVADRSDNCFMLYHYPEPHAQSHTSVEPFKLKYTGFRPNSSLPKQVAWASKGINEVYNTLNHHERAIHYYNADKPDDLKLDISTVRIVSFANPKRRYTVAQFLTVFKKGN